MPRLVIVVLLAACLAATDGCVIPGSSAKAAHSPAIGDTCLVGTWTLHESVNTDGYTFNNGPLRVAGLRGATMTFAVDGTGSEDFAESEPLLGTTADGGKLAITIRGTWIFSIKGTAGHYVETGAKADLPTTATFNGKPADYHSSYSPGNGTYSCSSSSLSMTTNDQVQTDSWSKG
jgi:hypothetical protein